AGSSSLRVAKVSASTPTRAASARLPRQTDCSTSISWTSWVARLRKKRAVTPGLSSPVTVMTAGSQPLLWIDSSTSGKASLLGWTLPTGVKLFALVTPAIEPQWLPEGGSPTPVFWEKKNHTLRSKGVVSAHSTSVLE